MRSGIIWCRNGRLSSHSIREREENRLTWACTRSTSSQLTPKLFSRQAGGIGYSLGTCERDLPVRNHWSGDARTHGREPFRTILFSYQYTRTTGQVPSSTYSEVNVARRSRRCHHALLAKHFRRFLLLPILLPFVLLPGCAVTLSCCFIWDCIGLGLCRVSVSMTFVMMGTVVK